MQDARRQFKSLSEALLEAQSLTSYDKAKENLENFIAEEPGRTSLKAWVEWWHKRRALIFPAFQYTKGGSKMNLAEVIHASWAKRDKIHVSA